MNYISTRGACANERRTFTDILLAGLAADGGLYLPAVYPSITPDELEHWRNLSYADLAYEVLAKFCDDIPAKDLRELTRRTYTAQIYRHARESEKAEQITPLKALGIENGAPLYLLELSNGPTLAFKDLAMQLLGRLFEYTLAQSGAQLNILGATSGDTGSAAEYAMRGKQGVRVFMLSPHQKMSSFQSAQMYSLQDPNIFNLAVTGVFDDCQDLVKAVSNDHVFKAQYKIGTVNSINWARVVAQIVYYVKGWLAATQPAATKLGQTSGPEALPKVSFCVPSGNFGNVCAGHIARMMGLPIDKLVVATNENDVLDEFFRTGVYRIRDAAGTYHTSSPSMDISKASNFERFVFDLLGRDAARVRHLFHQLEANKGFDLSGSGDFARIHQFGFVSGRSSHQERMATIQQTYARYATMIDTHTADGLTVARRYLEPGVPMVVLETAQPVKFSAAMREALGRDPERPAAFAKIEELPMRFEVVPPDAQILKEFIAAHTG
ncbi:threonine synthase [Mycoavidus cysteinexigens]|uniref:Threonine synthase n=1 Tax=Mycoavidus cysteinexigens TaxID=1553431 RepID=A0A2Z6EX87_9BURK|nr:threonine synthase [Mycoavidus cysteinexigens]BBE10037.1 threonine synthase [Mycoavidus cysteinexigens]GAM53621.1 threonine synthase [bacterium endosymbiont of Mortierella elongata FMR23-6]GLR01104.1 threonine synthase [Mycoavidus cysteinexigens]